MKKIECIIMDWAGTAVDYGCFAPVAAFIEAFAEKGLVIDVVQTRKPMGLPKIQHIRELLSMPDVNEQFTARYQRAWTEEDVVELNRLFEKHLFASLENYTDPIPGVIPTLEKLRAAGIKIGSTTGYTREMMDVVLPAAQAKGYHVDYCATPNLLPAGRPVPERPAARINTSREQAGKALARRHRAIQRTVRGVPRPRVTERAAVRGVDRRIVVRRL